jgi:hypothetical protein
MKTKLLIILLFLSINLIGIGQNQKTIQKKDSTVKIVKQMQPDKVADKIITLDSSKKVDEKTISIRNDSIAAMKKRMSEAISKDLYNGILPIHYLIAFIFAFMGMFIRWAFALGKTVQSKNDPASKFSWSLWAMGSLHKVMRVIATIFLVFIFLRFSNEVLGFAFSMFIALMIGFFIDFLADKFMQLKPETIFKKEIPTETTKPIV